VSPPGDSRAAAWFKNTARAQPPAQAGLCLYALVCSFSLSGDLLRDFPPSTLADYCCNGTIIEDEELGKVLQLQGDQRKNVSAFLLENQLCKKDQIKVHGS
jgi:hypothetical protein